MLRDAGAKEVHLRISAPPIRHPCHYGVDMSTREEMIAHDRTIEEIAEELGADSLAYLSMEGVYEAIGTPAEDHCDACFTGDYPLGDDPETPTASSPSRRSPSCPSAAEPESGERDGGTICRRFNFTEPERIRTERAFDHGVRVRAAVHDQLPRSTHYQDDCPPGRNGSRFTRPRRSCGSMDSSATGSSGRRSGLDLHVIT